MTNERKATDVLLDIESKLLEATVKLDAAEHLNNTLLKMFSGLNMNVANLSNKINILQNSINNLGVQNNKPSMNVGNLNNAIPAHLNNDSTFINSEDKMLIDENVTGYRRTARQNELLVNKKSNTKVDKNIVQQVQKQVNNEIAYIPPVEKINKQANQTFVQQPQLQESGMISTNKIPVQQTVVDANGKTLFLTKIVIKDALTQIEVFNEKTKPNGKWSALLTPGRYYITASRLENITKLNTESTQIFEIKSADKTVTLPNLVLQ